MAQQTTRQSSVEERGPAQTSAQTETTGIDKDANYGRYQRPTAELGQLHVNNIKWRQQLSKQVAHKALDEPFLGDDDEMRIDVDNRKEIHSGMGWKELTVIGVLALGTGGVGAASALLLSPKDHGAVDPPATTAPTEPADTNTDTLFIPKIRFGPSDPGEE